MVNQSWSAVHLEPKNQPLKASIKPRRENKSEQNFFRQAAALANHKWDEELVNPLVSDGDELVSHLLDESFQERLELFIHVAPLEALAEKTSLDLNQAMKKSRGLKPDWAPVTALGFHQKLKKLASDQGSWPLMILLENSQNWYLADRARVFCSLRLNKKSLQIKNGADPKVRYYHAALRDTKKPKKAVDVLYWLQFDEEQNPIDGGFIKEQPTPKLLLSSAELLAHFKLGAELSPPVNCILIKALKHTFGYKNE